MKLDKKIFYIDIDGIIFENDSSRMDYYTVVPIEKNIRKINKLYDEGHAIILWTARGGTTGIDWTTETKKQLFMENVKYHKLLMNKPTFDVFIDDRAYNSFEEYEKSKERLGL